MAHSENTQIPSSLIRIESWNPEFFVVKVKLHSFFCITHNVESDTWDKRVTQIEI